MMGISLNASILFYLKFHSKSYKEGTKEGLFFVGTLKYSDRISFD